MMNGFPTIWKKFSATNARVFRQRRRDIHSTVRIRVSSDGFSSTIDDFGLNATSLAPGIHNCADNVSIQNFSQRIDYTIRLRVKHQVPILYFAKFIRQLVVSMVRIQSYFLPWPYLKKIFPLAWEKIAKEKILYHLHSRIRSGIQF